ncbi:MAG: hypothetical protein K2Q01_04730 [Rickettsiales bacterium]|nr:hypothetical protein [Rickettsiales bacterium]
MNDLENYQAKIARIERGNGKNNSIGIKPLPDGTHKIILGLAGEAAPGVPGYFTQIVPVTLHVGKDGDVTAVEMPRQSRSGHVMLTPTPKLKEVLLGNAGYEGAEFIIRVSNALAGTSYTYEHTDPKQAFSKRSEGSVPVKLDEAVGHILKAATLGGARVLNAWDLQNPKRQGSAQSGGERSFP